jgi:hypothetical protein
MARTLPLASSDIDLEHDDLITMAEAAKLIPGEQPVNPHTIFRWHKYGAHGYRLESVFVCKKLYTTRAALFAFLRATSTQSGIGLAAADRARTKQASRRQAKRVLDRAKI